MRQSPIDDRSTNRIASVLAGALLFAFAGAVSAELPNPSTINKLARKACCSEAKIDSSELKKSVEVQRNGKYI